MTRHKLIRIAKLALTNHAGEPAANQAVAIADAIELVLQMEAPDEDPEGAGVVETTDVSRIPRSSAIVRPPENAPRESDRYAGTEQPPAPKPLLIMPDSEEAREILRGNGRQAIPVSRLDNDEAPAQDGVIVPVSHPNEGGGPPGDPVYWRVEKLSEELHKRTPPIMTIQLETENGPVPVKMERNVVIGHGFDIVKLIYKPPQVEDDFAVVRVFDIHTREINISKALSEIEEIAVRQYTPRNRAIVSHTPRKIGELTFNLNDKAIPHVEEVLHAGEKAVLLKSDQIYRKS